MRFITLDWFAVRVGCVLYPYLRLRGRSWILLLFLLPGIGWGSQVSSLREALVRFRDPLRFSATLYSEGQITLFVLAQNRGQFRFQRYGGWSYMRLSVGGRVQEVWQHALGSFHYSEGLLRPPGLLEKRALAQERLEARLFTHLRWGLKEAIEMGSSRLPDGQLANVWIVEVELGGKPYSLELYLHPLRCRLLGYSLWAPHPFREIRAVRTLLFSDYRRVAEWEVPFIKREYYDGQLFTEMKLWKLELAQRLNPRGLLEAARKQRAYYGRTPIRLALVKRSLLATVEVQLFGETRTLRARLLVDTGASTTILTSAVAKRLGLKTVGEVGARPIGTEIRLRSAFLPALRLGQIMISNKWIVTGDLGLIKDLLDVEGVLGSDVLALFRTTIDLQRSELVLEDASLPLRRVSKGVLEEAGRASRFLLKFETILGNPALRASLPKGQARWFILDTGARSTILPSALIDETLRQKSILLASGVGAGGPPIALKGVRLPALMLGDTQRTLSIPSIAALFPADPKTNILPDTDFGLIGVNILRRFRITLDYRRGVVIFEPSLYPQDNEASVGIMLNLSRDYPEIMSVIPLSPAQEVGLKRGDRLLKVGSRSTEGVDPAEVQRWLQGAEGSLLRLQVERDGITFEVEIRRETLIF